MGATSALKVGTCDVCALPTTAGPAIHALAKNATAVPVRRFMSLVFSVAMQMERAELYRTARPGMDDRGSSPAGYQSNWPLIFTKRACRIEFGPNHAPFAM